MIVIADSSPLNYLILIDLPEILEKLYGSVLIPPAVQRELQRASTPPPVQEWIARPPAWLEVRQITVPKDTLLSRLVSCPGDSVSVNATRGIGVGPAERLS